MDGVSKITSRGDLSSRMPLNEAWRTSRSAERPRNSTSHTISGFDHRTPFSAPAGRSLPRPGRGAVISSRRCRYAGRRHKAGQEVGEGAARLEGAGVLQKLKLEDELPRLQTEIGRRHLDHRRAPHVRGNANAPVTLEEFADFQCPACGLYYAELKKMESDFGDRLRVIFRENPLVPNHQFGLIAAQAAEAAGLQGETKFWAMHDKLYENQKTWSDAKDVVPIFVDYAKQIGIDPDRFTHDLNGEVVAARIFQDGKRSHALGVNSTPTFYVNGKEATGESWKPEGLREMIKQAASGAGQ